MKDLLAFLFGESQIRQDLVGMEGDLTRLFEQAAKVEADQSLASKTDLESALKEIGVEASSYEEDPAGCAALFDERNDFAKALVLVREPDNMHKLAEMGWVALKVGDVAMSNEPPEFRIRFLEFTVATDGISNDDKGPKQKDIAAQARERDTTAQDRDDELNPVETDDKGGKPKLGKAKDGADPEGKPKGASGKV